MASTWPAEAPAPALRRLREMLLQQRERFRRYLRVLDGQEQAILQEDVERLEAHVRLEREVLEEIQALHRAIEPLDGLCAAPAGRPVSSPPAPPEPGPGPSIAGPSIAELRRSLERLRGQVAERGRRNRLLLEQRLEGLRLRLRDLSPRLPSASPFSRAPEPALVDISL